MVTRECVGVARDAWDHGGRHPGQRVRPPALGPLLSLYGRVVQFVTLQRVNESTESVRSAVFRDTDTTLSVVVVGRAARFTLRHYFVTSHMPSESDRTTCVARMASTSRTELNFL